MEEFANQVLFRYENVASIFILLFGILDAVNYILIEK